MCTILIQVLNTTADLWLLFVLLFALNIFIYKELDRKQLMIVEVPDIVKKR